MQKYLFIFPLAYFLAACSPDNSSNEGRKSTDTTKAVETLSDTNKATDTEQVAALPEQTPVKTAEAQPKKRDIAPKNEKKESLPPPKVEEGGGKRIASLFDRFHTSQVLVVTAEDEDAIQGTLRLYEWDANKKTWNTSSEKIAVTLGKDGLAWAKGLHPQPWNIGTMKKEGDGKAPQGIFEISSLFGYKEKSALSFRPKMPYTHSTSSYICVDDINSAHYNQILDSKGVTADWKSKEDMLRKDNLYELGAVVAYNTQNIVKGDGSCVFLHIWRAADKPTAGCTAMTAENAKNLFSQLDASKKPLLIQLTKDNYDKYKNVLQFP